jgi:hypothetical protein
MNNKSRQWTHMASFKAFAIPTCSQIKLNLDVAPAESPHDRRTHDSAHCQNSVQLWQNHAVAMKERDIQLRAASWCGL